jgi:hypothetical protein
MWWKCSPRTREGVAELLLSVVLLEERARLNMPIKQVKILWQRSNPLEQDKQTQHLGGRLLLLHSIFQIASCSSDFKVQRPTKTIFSRRRKVFLILVTLSPFKLLITR